MSRIRRSSANILLTNAPWVSIHCWLTERRPYEGVVYMHEATSQNWSKRALERQIGPIYDDRAERDAVNLPHGRKAKEIA